MTLQFDPRPYIERQYEIAKKYKLSAYVYDKQLDIVNNPLVSWIECEAALAYLEGDLNPDKFDLEKFFHSICTATGQFYNLRLAVIERQYLNAQPGLFPKFKKAFPQVLTAVDFREAFLYGVNLFRGYIEEGKI